MKTTKSETIKPWKVGDQITFTIEKLDNLGQGIYRHGEFIVFIPKTLPGESGNAIITRVKKKVAHAQLTQLNEQLRSKEREVSPCPHFQKCSGCDYLHLSYEAELKQKEQALRYYLRPWLDSQMTINLYPSPVRLGYRTRLQLHYHGEQLGMVIDGRDEADHLLAIPHCQLPITSIQNALKNCYLEVAKLGVQNWLKALPDQQYPDKIPMSGHLEWQERPQGKELSLAINRPYGHLGFTQVHSTLNLQMKQRIKDLLLEMNPRQGLLDLFSGTGNFIDCVPALTDSSEKTAHQKSSYYLGIDRFIGEKSFPYLVSMDLMHHHATRDVIKKYQQSPLAQCQGITLLIDPPRSGWSFLGSFVAQLEATTSHLTQIIYISCWPSALHRDLLTLPPNWTIHSAEIFDFFPSTKHFETLVCLRLAGLST